MSIQLNTFDLIKVL